MVINRVVTGGGKLVVEGYHQSSGRNVGRQPRITVSSSTGARGTASFDGPAWNFVIDHPEAMPAEINAESSFGGVATAPAGAATASLAPATARRSAAFRQHGPSAIGRGQAPASPGGPLMIGINGRLGWSVVSLAIVFAGGAWATRRAAVPGSPGPRPALVSRPQGPPPGGRPAARGTVVHDGIRVELRITPVASPDAPADGPLLEGQDVRVAFAISDTAGGLPLAKVYPSAWAVPRRPDARPTTPRRPPPRKR